MGKIIEKYKEYTIVYEPSSHYVDFTIFEIIGYSKGNKDYDIPIYEKKEAKDSSDDTNDIKEAETLIKGHVKWDGCSHYYFGGKDGYIHLCGKSNIDDISDVIKKIYYRCGELMGENSDKEEFNHA